MTGKASQGQGWPQGGAPAAAAAAPTPKTTTLILLEPTFAADAALANFTAELRAAAFAADAALADLAAELARRQRLDGEVPLRGLRS